AGAPTGRDVGRFNDAMDFSWVRSSGEGTPASVAEFLRRTEESQRHQHRAGVLGQRGGLADARLQNLRGTDIERLLTGPEMRLAAGIDPTLELGDEATLEAASPLRGMSLSRLRAIEEAHARMHESGHCVVHAEFADEGLLGLARAIARATERGDGTLEWYGRTYRLTGEDGALDYAAVRDMLRHPIFHGVTAHEIGHTLGLRHNFSGSHDALNYQPRYWELRDDGSMAPRAYDPITDEEIDGRIAEYQYSTVMDYGNNFVVTDAHGVGHYDHAAIKMGYGDLVEVFTDAPEPAEIAWWGWIQQAGWPVPLKVSSFTGGRPSAYQYTDWPIEMGGREALQARADVPYTSLQADGFLASQGIGDAVVDPEGRPMVPYMFCTDHQADLGPDCQRYDAGADAYEAVLSIIDSYWNYYVFNAFGRGRVGFTVDSYASRVHGRYFEKLKRANQIYALYRGVFEDIFGEAGTANFMVAEDGFGAWTTAVGSAFELLTRVVANPEPGNYIESLRPDGSPAYQAGSSLFALEVDPFEGRGLETRWDQDEGFFWFENLERVGYYYDKSLALQVLLDPQTNFLGRDTAADVRRYQLSFYTTFGPSTEGLIGGLVGSDWSAIAPRFDADALRYPTALELRERLPIEGTPIDPNTSFSIQLAAATYGMALIPETYDRSFFQRARVWLRNGPEGVEPAEGTPVVEFTNPSTGLIYVAASYPDASGEETGPGARMIRHAQRLAATGQFDALTDFVDNLDIVRRLSWRLEFGD
ncbi:MAG: zinc-dependent metalloprotease, partial [Myxococcota bacterium]